MSDEVSEDANEPAPDDTEEGEEEAEGEPKKLSKLKMIILAIVALWVVGGAGAGVYFSGILHVDKKHEVSLILPGNIVYQDVPKITVDLKPTKKHPRPFIRMVIQVELEGDEAKLVFIEREAKILDEMNTQLRATTLEEINAKGGALLLKAKLLAVINKIIKPNRAVGVLYKKIIVR